jgi:hypothetical protein
VHLRPRPPLRFLLLNGGDGSLAIDAAHARDDEDGVRNVGIVIDPRIVLKASARSSAAR